MKYFGDFCQIILAAAKEALIAANNIATGMTQYLGHSQCDLIARLFIQYLTFDDSKRWIK